MSAASDRKSLIVIASVFGFVVTSTYVVTLLARGYRPDIREGGITISATGLLSATSQPKGAMVYVNDKLTTATDDTLNLSPGEYLLKIAKDGYFPWQKSVKIKKEIVFQSDAQLFRSSPDMAPITPAGAINPTISPDFTKIIFAVASASATADNGLYIIELTGNFIPLTKNTPRLIAANTAAINWSRGKFEFSPDSREILVTFSGPSASYLLNLNTNIDLRTLRDISATLPSIRSQWQAETTELTSSRLALLPPALAAMVSTSSPTHVLFNTAADKVLYLAAKSGPLPGSLITAPPAQSSQVQNRSLAAGNYYVYDLKDDTNFLIGSTEKVNNPFWIPNSANVIYTHLQNIIAVDYDATNKNTLFVGDISADSIYPWPDGNKIIVLMKPYPGSQANLYSITIR